MNVLTEAIKRVSHELSGRKVVTEEEIRRISMNVLLSFYISNPELDFVEIEERIVESMCSEPETVNSLFYSEKMEIGGVEFRHIHTYSPTGDLVGEAYDEYLRSKKFFNSLDRMKEITDRFFSGYSVNEGLVRSYSKKKFKYGVFYSTIHDVEKFLDIHEDFSRNFDGEYVVAVTTENEIGPFLKFFRKNSQRVNDSGMKIWVINAEQMSIDPFIGYPKDFTLLKGFRNPKVASQINSLWREKVDQID